MLTHRSCHCRIYGCIIIILTFFLFVLFLRWGSNCTPFMFIFCYGNAVKFRWSRRKKYRVKYATYLCQLKYSINSSIFSAFMQIQFVYCNKNERKESKVTILFSFDIKSLKPEWFLFLMQIYLKNGI